MRGLSRGQLQFTDSPVRLYDPRPSQALRCHVVAAKRRFAAMTHGELTADLVALSPTTPHPNSLAAAADAFLDHADVAATTRRVYRMSLAALVDGLGPARAMADVTGELVDDWFRARYATVA